MEKDNLKVEYFYQNDYNKSKNFSVEAEGRDREELINNLISKKSGVALYWFMKCFPDLSDEDKNLIKEKILEIEKIRNLNELIFPEHYYLFTSENLYYRSENKESLHWLK